jgi:PAS domain S-box-containing protein
MSTSAVPASSESQPDPDAASQAGASPSLLAATKQILEMIAAGASLPDILTNLCDAIDRQNPDMMSMVSLMDPDGQRLWPAAAPRVPAEFVEAISPLLIGENMSSCGTAAFRKERVIIADVAGDPLRSGLGEGRRREMPLKHGLRATWSQPLLSKDGEVLGTFGMFHPTPRSPTERELRLIEDAATIAVIAIEGERAQAALRKAFHEIETSEQELRGIVDAISQIIGVLGADGSGLYANRPLLEYTGLTMEQLMTPDARGNPVLYHPEDWARLQDERRAGLSRAMPFELEWRVRRRDGEYRWFLVRYHPLRDEEGRILRWYASGTDIDDRKRAEERVRNENLALREEIDRSSMFEEIVGSSSALKGVLAQVARVATTDSTVLILGETGTGKELVARAIHRRSGRSSRAFIRVNCAAIPP